MKDYRIFVEGQRDQAFLETFLSKIGILCRTERSSSNVINIEGWTNMGEERAKNKLLEAVREQKTICIIFDADDPTKDYGGKETRLARLRELLGELHSHVNIFLFPNHDSDGDFETLLQKIARPEHKALFECWEGYSECVTRKNYNKPTNKSKVWEFAAAIDDSVWKDRQGFNKSFTNPEIWNLESPALEPLRQFLFQHLGHLIPQIPKSPNP